MKKKIEWWIVEADGKDWFSQDTRKNARAQKALADEHIFDEWYKEIKFPVRIVRREYHLVDEKVVR